MTEGLRRRRREREVRREADKELLEEARDAGENAELQVSSIKMTAHLASETNDRDPAIITHEQNFAAGASLPIAKVPALGGREEGHAVSGLTLLGGCLLQLGKTLRGRHELHAAQGLWVVLKGQSKRLAEGLVRDVWQVRPRASTDLPSWVGPMPPEVTTKSYLLHIRRAASTLASQKTKGRGPTCPPPHRE